VSELNIQTMDKDLIEGVGRKILENVLEALDYWAWNCSPSTPLETYSSYNSIDLYDAACDFCGWSRAHITEEDLKFLQEMPDEIYDKLNQEYHERLEGVIEKLSEEDE